MASPSLIRLTLELHTRISFLETILQASKRKPDFEHHIRSMNSYNFFFAPYLLRHLTTDKRNLVTDYNVSVGGARGSKNICPTITHILIRN